MSAAVACEPATAGRWDDLEAAMRGCSYARKCWCAYWYLPNADYRAGWGEANAGTLRARVAAGEEPGVIAYVEGVPAGWCAVAPREKHDRLLRSRTFVPIDAAPVWSVTCFVVRTGYRRQGLMRTLLEAAVEHAARKGATTIEGYPVEPGEKTAASDLYFGTAAAFLDCGFTEVARPLPRRPVMRRTVRPAPRESAPAGTAGRG